MSNSIYPAFNGLQLQPESTQDVSVEGMVSIHAAYTGSLVDIAAQNISPGSPHPNYGYVGVQTFRTSSLAGDWGRLEINYLGAYSLGLKYYARQKSITKIPVQQASNFEKVAGTADDPLNDAIFDQTTGQFLGWKATSAYDGQLNLDATKLVVTETSVTASPVDGPAVNSQPTSCPGPYAIGPAIFMGASNTQLGYVVFRNVLTWQNIPTAEIPIIPGTTDDS